MKTFVIWKQDYDAVSIIAVLTEDKLEEAKATYRSELISDLIRAAVHSQTSTAPYTVHNILNYDTEGAFGITYETNQLISDKTVTFKESQYYDCTEIELNVIEHVLKINR